LSIAIDMAPRDGTSANQQPIAFNHLKHVEEVDLECDTCHQFYAKETFSGLPRAEVCTQCHEEAQGSSPEEAKLVQLIQGGKPLEWRSLFRQPPHVFFSHRRHAVVAEMQCADCHGTIAKSEAPPTRVKKLRMDDCIVCHELRGASTDCTACHR
jgi:hypothetical protein